MNAVDTNILIYSLDQHDDTRRRRALKLLDSLPGKETVIPWQVACEFAAVLLKVSREGRFKGDYAKTVSSMRSRFQIVTPQLSTLDRSLRIQINAQVSPWDSLLIAACADAGVTRLYTEDLQGRPVIEGVEFVNPLV